MVLPTVSETVLSETGHGRFHDGTTSGQIDVKWAAIIIRESCATYTQRIFADVWILNTRDQRRTGRYPSATAVAHAMRRRGLLQPWQLTRFFFRIFFELFSAPLR